MVNRITILVLFVVFFIVTSSVKSKALSDTVSSFGENGVVVKDFGFGNDEAYDTIVQQDGKILVAGYSYYGADKQLFVARYDSGGNLDTTFNQDGIFTYGIGGENYIARQLYLTDEGKIVVVARDEGLAPKAYILELDSGGNLDKSFATDGIYSFSLPEKTISEFNVTQANDKSGFVFLVSVQDNNAISKVLFARLNASGIIDASLGESGLVEVSSIASFSTRSIISANDEGFFAVGSIVTNNIEQAAVTKITETGSLDTSFGSNGIQTILTDSEKSIVNDILYDSTNKSLWLAGEQLGNTYTEAFIAKMTLTGQLYQDFSDSGIEINALNYNNGLYSLALSVDGSILGVGFAQPENDQEVLLMNVSAQSKSMASEVETDSNDQLFAVETSLVDLSAGIDVSYGVAANNDGEFYIAGTSGLANNLDASLFQLSKIASLSTTNSGAETSETTNGYKIYTFPVTKITHTGAATGGKIEQNAITSCDQTCSEQCSNSSTVESCYSECYSSCTSETVTITLRGVCYSTHQNPQYQTTTETGTTETTSSDTTSTTTTTINTSLFPKGNLLSAYIVHQGWTEDGTGVGSYNSEITNITPGMTYYVRAFALLSDGSIIYGNERSFKSIDACFIATAAYGSIFTDEVRAFRFFRDNYLMKLWVGEKIVAMYYKISPSLAEIIRSNESIRLSVRVLLFPFYVIICFLQYLGLVKFILFMVSALCIPSVMIALRKRAPIYRASN